MNKTQTYYIVAFYIFLLNVLLYVNENNADNF